MLATESEFVKEVCANVPFYTAKLDLMTGRWYITIMFVVTHMRSESMTLESFQRLHS